MARSRRGGARTPANPAPVSGPGALSQRTDGQPIREAPAEFHGQRKQLREQQQGAPLAAGSPSSPQSSAGPGSGLGGGVFGPSERPNEPVSAGASQGPGPSNLGTSFFFEEDPDEALRAMYRAYPHPSLLRLLRGSEPQR